ncbi:twin-arginine translocation signal domain-containing protein [Dyella sp. LX-66]|uniref:twin-arginine translocation signal domain-containing protein n=1 Tax=unclassified Dyella TaxID=2634549 RepID=UPI001BE081FB|nr:MULTISPECIES: twin-arginine translocation signal domain-containing protein [unclassified Dyella]MBT2118059.1 twin-arginine translocation signal domain-containing protein [Dyella sp. LX-1]MBT2140966.1 twin-arginine translocation signal domain-containing protein [Dyella sp. LX-66]
MDRRRFLQGLAATSAAAGLVGWEGASAQSSAQAGGAGTLAPPQRIPLAALSTEGHARLAGFDMQGAAWSVFEDLSTPDGAITLTGPDGGCVLGKRTESCAAEAGTPYLGLALKELALADADLLADRLLKRGEPDPEQVRLAAPPLASTLDPKDYNGRLPWTTFVGNVACADTMPVFPDGRTRTFKPMQETAALRDEKLAPQRREGLLGGWLPAVHKVFALDEGRWYDVLVFADVDAADRFVVQTWHRTALVEHGRISEVHYGYSYPSYPPTRQPPSADAFYRALLRFHDAWQQQLADACAMRTPDPSWADMARYAFARELVVRPGGSYPKYGAVDRDYYGNEYDGFQDTFTSSLYANIEWGRNAQAAVVLDGYFTDFVQADGMVNMRGAETGQFGLTLSLLARYLHYTGDVALLRKHQGKIEATARILLDLHDASLRLPNNDPGHGLLHGWNESDACLFPEPQLWWKPYYANSALASRGLRDLAAVWVRIDAHGKALADRWQERSRVLAAQLVRSLRANVRHDLHPPYIGPLPGVKLTFRQSLLQEKPSEQQWPHRAYAELLQADVLPDDLAHLVIDCMRGHGATSIGVVANVAPPSPDGRDILGFISYGYAQQLLRLGRIDEYLLFLYAHRYHAHTPGSWTAGEVSDLSGGMPLFCMPAQLTMPLLLRWMVVFEDSEGEVLHLARAVPRRWMGGDQAIEMRGAPTRWGRVDVRLQPDGGHGVTGEIRLPEAAPAAVWLSLRAPEGKRLADVHVEGATVKERRGDSVRLDGRPGQAVRVSATFA